MEFGHAVALNARLPLVAADEVLQEAGKALDVGFDDADGLDSSWAEVLSGWTLAGADETEEGFVVERKFNGNQTP